MLGLGGVVTGGGAGAVRRAEQSVASAINRAAGGRPIPGNQVRLLIDGPEAYAAMLDVIAERHPLDPLRELHHPERRGGPALRRGAAPRARARACTCACCTTRFGSLEHHARATGAPSAQAGVEVRAFHPLSASSTWSPTSPAITASWSWPTARAP